MIPQLDSFEEVTARAVPRFRVMGYSKPEPVRWLWHRALAENTVVLLSGAKSVMKSYLGHGLAAAIVLGHAEFLGHALSTAGSGGKVLVIDAENNENVIAARLNALGIPEEYWGTRLRYVDPSGDPPQIGHPASDAALAAEVEEFDPHLIIIDGSVSATVVGDTGDVEAIKRFYAAVRTATGGHRAATLVYHHERKRHAELGRGAADQAAIGSVFWLNLADNGLALEFRDQQTTPREDGAYRLVTTSEIQVTKPPRLGAPLEPLTFAVDSEFSTDDMLHTSVVRLADDPTILPLVRALVRLADETQESVGSGDWAKAAGFKDSSDSEYDRLRQRALAAGFASRVSRGKYLPTDKGREIVEGTDLA